MAFVTSSHPPKRRFSRQRVSVFDLLALYRQRRALGRLDAETLEDLGITKEEAMREARRPFWDIPTK